MSATQTKETVNGVNMSELLKTVGAIKDQPDLGRFQFRAANQWLGAAHNRTTIQSFYGAGQEDTSRTHPYVFDCDEPPVLLGKDEGANPVEHLLNALAGCMTTTMVMHSASRGVEIEAVESKLEGDIDVRGFLGLNERVPRGYEKIRVTFKVNTDADAEQLKKLAEMSPVYNTISKPTPIEIEIVKQ